MRRILILVIFGISLFGCMNFKTNRNLTEKYNSIKQERDSLLSIVNQKNKNMEK